MRHTGVMQLDLGMEISREERKWAAAAHLCGVLWLAGGTGLFFFPLSVLVLFTMVGPLIIWLSKGASMAFVAEQAKESLNFQITVFLWSMLFLMLAIVLIGFVFLWILGLINLVLVLIAAINVSDGKHYRYPFCLRLVK